MTNKELADRMRNCCNQRKNVDVCDGCPFRANQNGCRNMLMMTAARIVESQPDTVFSLDGIMIHYKKPLVTISIQEMDDEA